METLLVLKELILAPPVTKDTIALLKKQSVVRINYQFACGDDSISNRYNLDCHMIDIRSTMFNHDSFHKKDWESKRVR